MTALDRESVNKILDETYLQVERYSEIFQFDNIETVYIGGGTPTCISVDQLDDFLFRLASLLPANLSEFTIEVNPETVDKSLAGLLQSSAVTRVSMGIQSFDEKFLNILGRSCSVKSIYDSLEIFKNLASKDLSLDIISSIPGQKPHEAVADLEKALIFEPEHVSLYYLTIEENTRLGKKYSPEDQNEYCWLKSCDYLSSKNYTHYEISNFAKNGKKCQHNLNYWRMIPYMGCGMSAVSTLIFNNEVRRITNTDNVNLYLEGKDKNWNSETEVIDKKDFLTETLMMGLRTDEGVDLDMIKKRFNIDLAAALDPLFLKWEKRRYTEIEGNRFILTRKGRFFHSSIMVDMMSLVENLK